MKELKIDYIKRAIKKGDLKYKILCYFLMKINYSNERIISIKKEAQRLALHPLNLVLSAICLWGKICPGFIEAKGRRTGLLPEVPLLIPKCVSLIVLEFQYILVSESMIS